jgi:hypothetical protein
MRLFVGIVAGVLAIIAAGLAGLVTHQRSELQRAAEAATAAATERALLTKRIQDLERRLLRPPDALTGLATPPGMVPPTGGESALPPDPPLAGAIEQERAFVAAVLADPKRREAMLAQNRLIARMQHGDIIKRLDLPLEQVDALIEILAQRQLANFGRGSLAASEDPIAAQQRLQELDQTETDEIAKLLGADKAARFGALRTTLGARATLLPVVQDLELARIPLSAEQHDTLASILHEQTEALRNEMPLPDIAVTATGPTAEQMSERASRWRERQAELHRRVLEKASATLTPAQQKRLAAYLQQQLDLESLSWSGPAS